MTEQTYQDMVARTDSSGQIIVFQDNTTGFLSTSDYWLMAAINWGFAIVLFFVIQ